MSTNGNNDPGCIGYLVIFIICGLILWWGEIDQNRQVEKCTRRGGIPVETYAFSVTCVPKEAR